MERAGRRWPWRRLGAQFGPIRPEETKFAGPAGESPAGFVDQDVMMPAEQDQIVDAGLPSFGPVDEMVDIAPIRDSITGREHTSQVPSAYRSP